ncbi:MAG TPA: thiamine pyrophosphate-dependent dehydrogenase E1 component subunit alpha [Gemmatimonadales bacterium]
MRRFPAFDPPEYVAWTADPAVVDHFERVCDADPARRAIIAGIDQRRVLALYAGLVRTRLHDVMLKRWVHQGVISKAWLGTGEEAATVGPTHALDRDRDVVAPMIRNAGACCEMGMSVANMLRGYLGTSDAPSRGRDGHVGDMAHRVLQPISHIGNMPPVTAGIALAFKLRGEGAVALTWIGDGSVNAGPTHEALNFAAVQRLPAIFIIQNNQVALGTRARDHRLPADFTDLHRAYGARGWPFDGNNVLDAFAATRLAADACRAGDGPVLLAAETFRMGGHATHDEHEARTLLPPELFQTWGARDPIGVFEEYLKRKGVSAQALEAIEERVTVEVDQAAEEALESQRSGKSKPASAVEGVYAS